MQLKPASAEVEAKLRQVQGTIASLKQSGNDRWKHIKNFTRQQLQVPVNPAEPDQATPVWTQRMETLFGPLSDQLRLIRCDNCGILTRETNSKVGVTHKLNCEMSRKSGSIVGSLINKKFGAQFSNHLELNSKKRASSEVSLDSSMPTKKKKKTIIIDYTTPAPGTGTVAGSTSSQQSPESSHPKNHQRVINGVTVNEKQFKKAMQAVEKLEREAERKEKKRLEEEARKAKKITRAKGGPVNVNEQCGVLVPPNDTPCARSLTCKTHSMGAKRSVPGRSAPYDVLLNEWQKKHNPNWGNRKVVTPRVGPGIEPGQSRKKKKEVAGNAGGGNNRASNKSNNNNDPEGSNNNPNRSTQADSNSKDPSLKDNNNTKDKTANSNQSKSNNSSKPSGGGGLNGHNASGSSNKKSSGNLNGAKGDHRVVPEKISAANQAKLLGEVDEDFYMIVPSSSNDNTAKQKRVNEHDHQIDEDGDTMMNERSQKMHEDGGSDGPETIDAADLEFEAVLKGLIVSQNFRQQPLDLHPYFDFNSCSYLTHASNGWSKISKLGVKDAFKNALKAK